MRKFTALLERIVPDKGVKETPHLTHLDIRMVESPVIGLEQSRGEILKMVEGVDKMMSWTGDILRSDEPDEALVKKVFHREEVMDNVEVEVVRFLNALQTGSVPHSVTQEATQQYRISDELESISDYVSTVLKSHLRLVHAGQRLIDDERENLIGIHAQVSDYLKLIMHALENRQSDVLSKASTQGDSITHHFKDLREAHLRRVAAEQVDPVYSMSYSTMILGYRRIKDHAFNIAEAMAGEK